MNRAPEQLTSHALQIWHAGVDAVRPRKLIPQFVAVSGQTIQIGDVKFELREIGRIVVVGAGKAGAEMVLALEEALGEELLREKHVTGWVNVPADCMRTTRSIHLHAARPAAINEPTLEGVQGTQRILELVSNLTDRDLCICLVSGGGSALMPAPIEGISLNVKVALTREIAANGGDIHQLNTVRRELSLVKGGGLARACRARHLVSLILSDVMGDDLSTIASGPTVSHDPAPDEAIEVLKDLGLLDHPAGKAALKVWDGTLRGLRLKLKDSERNAPNCQITNLLIGNNAAAVDAAGLEAERLGYSHAMTSASEAEGSADEVGTRLAEMAQVMCEHPGPDCLISGGETIVKLSDAGQRGLGGRNQQLALAALSMLQDWREVALVSAGTDGEDGPTDAAGAIVDEAIARRSSELHLDPRDFLRRNDAYHFFGRVGGLLKTGPTGTNVGDLRVLTVSR